MEGLLVLLAGAIRWCVSLIKEGKLKKWMILVIFLSTITPTVVYLIFPNMKQGSNENWQRATCALFGNDDQEKAETLLFATPSYVQFQTNQGRILEFKISYNTEYACTIIRKSEQTSYKPVKDCAIFDRFNVAPPPGKVIDTMSVEACNRSKDHTGANIHTEYAILKDGSLWYWTGMASSNYSDIYIIICGTPFAFLCGIGLIWLYINRKYMFYKIESQP